MCLQCQSHCTNQGIEQSKDELWSLFRVSYERYQAEVINDSKIYERYVNDLISYYLPVFSSEKEVVRKHFQNLFCVYELLNNRKDLVEKYFNKCTFEKSDFSKMVYEFNHVETVPHESKILAYFNRKQIKLITDFANKKKFFTSPVDEKTIEDFFNCTLKKPLIVTNLRYVLQLLYLFSLQKMIPNEWESIVELNKMLAPQKTMTPSKSGAMSSRLTELKEEKSKFPEKDYVDIVKQLKEMY